MQERILQMCDDFVAAGIEAYMDITKVFIISSFFISFLFFKFYLI